MSQLIFAFHYVYLIYKGDKKMKGSYAGWRSPDESVFRSGFLLRKACLNKYGLAWQKVGRTRWELWFGISHFLSAALQTIKRNPSAFKNFFRAFLVIANNNQHQIKHFSLRAKFSACPPNISSLHQSAKRVINSVAIKLLIFCHLYQFFKLKFHSVLSFSSRKQFSLSESIFDDTFFSGNPRA